MRLPEGCAAMSAETLAQIETARRVGAELIRGEVWLLETARPTLRFRRGRPQSWLGSVGRAVLLTALTACAGAKPPCDSTTAAAMAAACAARVQAECVAQGVPESECKVIAECDKAADERQAKCGGGQ